MNEKLYSQIPGNHPLQPVSFPVVGANGQNLGVLGQFRLPIKLSKTCVIERDVLVSRALKTPFIIGADVLRDENLILDTVQGKIRRVSEYKQVLCTRKMSLPAGQEKAVYINTPFENQEVMFVPFSPEFPPCLMRTNKEGKGRVLWQNGSMQTSSWERGEHLGRVQLAPKAVKDVAWKKVCNAVKRGPEKNDGNLIRDQVKLDHLSPTLQTCYHDLLSRFSDILSLDPNEIGNCNVLPQHIILKNAQKTTCIPPYRNSPHLQHVVKSYVGKLLDAGVIQRSTSPFCSPLLLVKKANSTASQPLVEQYRVVHDFRALNDNTIRDSYPLHNLYDLIDRVAAAKIWSVIDLSSGFWNQQLTPDSRPLTAFAVPGIGHFEYTRSAQGLCNSPAAFQRLLDFVVRDLDNVFVYIDDIVITSGSHEEHLATWKKVLERFRTYNLKCRPGKIQIATAEINYLGYNLSHTKGIRPGFAKTECVRRWTSPTNVKEIRQFLGLCSFFRRTVKDFASIASPLTKLTRKDSPFVSGPLPDPAEKAFQELKKILVSRPCLTPPSFDKPFILTVDASTKGLGAVLSQVGTKGEEHPIAYASRVLTEPETKKAPFHLEYLAMVWACRHFKPYLIGRKFKLRSDHKPLQVLNRVHGQAFDRYLLELADYDFEVEYLKGDKMPADGLSRQTCATETITPLRSRINFSWSQIKSLQKQDKWIKGIIIAKLYNSYPTNPALLEFVRDHEKKTVIYEGVLCSHSNPLDPRAFAPLGIRQTLLNMAHDCPGAGHYAFDKTLHRLTQSWYWPTMQSDVLYHCRSCVKCKSTNQPALPPAPLQTLPLATDFNNRLHIDLLGPLPDNAGHRYVLIMVDAFSKYLHLAPLADKTMDSAVEAFYDSWICSFGIPSLVVSDLGKEFNNQLFNKLKATFQFTHNFSSANHAMSNGQAEASVKETLRYVRKYIQGNEWLMHLPNIRQAHNTSVHSSIKTTPYQAVFCRQPFLPLSLYPPQMPREKTYSPHFIENQLRHLEKTRYDIIAESEHAFQAAKKQFDRRAELRKFEKGDKVFIKRSHQPKQFQKFQPAFHGPFIVLGVGSHGNLTLVPFDVKARPRKFKVHANNVRMADAVLQFFDVPGELPQSPNTQERATEAPDSPVSFIDDDPVVHEAEAPTPQYFSPSVRSSSPSSHFSTTDSSLQLSTRLSNSPQQSWGDQDDDVASADAEDEEAQSPSSRSGQESAESTSTNNEEEEENADQNAPPELPPRNVASRTRSRGTPLPDDVLHSYLPLRQRRK